MLICHGFYSIFGVHFRSLMRMLPRLLQLPPKQSFFLFGARHTGKSTLIKNTYATESSLFIDLLDPLIEDRLLRNPEELQAWVEALPEHITHIIIDEIQKIPRLLDSVHRLIELTPKYFVLTGSSARKLKYGGANLLAGRAFVYYLFPFTFLELKSHFNLANVLRWGMLPGIESYISDEEKQRFLQSYALTYLKEEIWAEHLIKKLEPFRRFLEVSAQANGKIINYANIARDVGADEKTVKEYFSLLEDTLVGFILEPFHHSFRKRLSAKPKFYYFDLGVVRALARSLSIPLQAGTSAYGEAFEHFIIGECWKLTHYFQPEFRLSYLQTKDDAEIDLIIERPGKPLLLIEIKSSSHVREQDLTTLQRFAKELGICEAVCFSQDIQTKQYGDITIYPWQIGIQKFFNIQL